MELLAQTKATVVYNPASNMYLASGVCPVPQLRSIGVNVAVGTDAATTDATFDLLGHLNLGCLLQKVHHLDPKIFTAKEMLQIAYHGGARAMPQGEELGSLEPGKKADLITIDVQVPHLQPFNDPVAGVVYGATGNDVSTVIVDGRVILKDKMFVDPKVEPLLELSIQQATEFVDRVTQELLK